MSSRKIIVLAFALAMTASVAVAWNDGATADAVPGAHLNTSAGFTAAGAPLALHGFDPVAYFVDDEATLGQAPFSTAHDGATYRFASAENQAAFEAEPDRYLPEFGGFCAFGVTVGKKFDGDPRQWAIHDGKLYLNLNAEISELWRQDVPGNVDKAKGEWTAIRGVPASAL